MSCYDVDYSICRSLIEQSIESGVRLNVLCVENNVSYVDIQAYIKKKLSSEDAVLHKRWLDYCKCFCNKTKVSNLIKSKSDRFDLYDAIIRDCISTGDTNNLEEIANANSVGYTTIIAYVTKNLKSRDIDLYNEWVNLRSKVCRYTYTEYNKDFVIFIEDIKSLLLDTYSTTGELKKLRNCIKLCNKYNWKESGIWCSNYFKDEVTTKTYNVLRLQELEHIALLCKTYYTQKLDNIPRYKINQNIIALYSDYDRQLAKGRVGGYINVCFHKLKRNKHIIDVSTYEEVEDLYNKVNDKINRYVAVIKDTIDHDIPLSESARLKNVSYTAVTKFISRGLKDYDIELYNMYKNRINQIKGKKQSEEIKNV